MLVANALKVKGPGAKRNLKMDEMAKHAKGKCKQMSDQKLPMQNALENQRQDLRDLISEHAKSQLETRKTHDTPKIAILDGQSAKEGPPVQNQYEEELCCAFCCIL